MGRKRKNRQPPWPSATLNVQTYMQWELYLKNIALNVYTWENLPETCDARWLELQLYEQGFCLFFQDPDLLRYLTLQCTISGTWNVYNIPIERTAYASNDYHCHRTQDNSVLIYNNYTHTPTHPIVRQYAQRIYELERSIDVNVKAQKTPVTLLANETQRLSMMNLFEQYDGNAPYIFLDSETAFGEIKALNTAAPFVGPGLFQLKQFYLNEFLSIMGVENSNQDKRAQMTANEIGSNYGQIEMSRYTGLAARKQAAKQINDMFGLNVSVNVSSKLETLVNRPFIGSLETFEPQDVVPSNTDNMDEKEEDDE